MKKHGFSFVELLVAIFIMSVILAAATSFYIHSINENSRQRIKASVQSNVKEVFRIIESDIRHAGFGLKKTPPCGGISIFAVDNCSSSSSTFCVKGTTRFFIANGWEIIRDFTVDNCPDGQISNSDYDLLTQREFYSTVTLYVRNTRYITVDRLNIDNKSRKLASSGALCGVSSSVNRSDDIRSRNSIIVSGCTDNLNNTNSEGKRISSVDDNTNTITFVSREQPLKYYNCNSGCGRGIVLPAIAWYIRKSSDGSYWLYRNEYKVMKDVSNFKVEVGYDMNGNGMVDNNTEIFNSIPVNAQISRLRFFLIEITTFYSWKNKKFYLTYKTRVEAFH